MQIVLIEYQLWNIHSQTFKSFVISHLYYHQKIKAGFLRQGWEHPVHVSIKFAIKPSSLIHLNCRFAERGIQQIILESLGSSLKSFTWYAGNVKLYTEIPIQMYISSCMSLSIYILIYKVKFFAINNDLFEHCLVILFHFKQMERQCAYYYQFIFITTTIKFCLGHLSV